MKPDEKMSRQEIEFSFIGALLYDEDKSRKVTRFPFTTEDFLFYRPMFTSVVETVENDGMCDIMLAKINGNLKHEEYKDFVENLNFHPSMVEFYAKKLSEMIVEEKSNALRKSTASKIIAGEDPLTIVAAASNELNEIKAIYGGEETHNDLTNALKDVFEKIEKAEACEALKFGFSPADSLTFGLMPGDNVILAARPSCGKTAFALQLMVMLAKMDIKSFFVSIEMSAKAILGRILASVLKMDMRQKIRSPELTPDHQRTEILATKKQIAYLAERIITTTRPIKSAQQMEAEARRAVKNGAKLIVCDYLQLMDGKGANRNNQVEYISRCWKNMLKELQVPGILLSQLSRKCEEERRLPKLSDLRDSGSIEQDADLIWFLASKPDKNGMMDRSNEIFLLQAKGRDSGIGKRELFFQRETQTFYPLEEVKGGQQ